MIRRIDKYSAVGHCCLATAPPTVPFSVLLANRYVGFNIAFLFLALVMRIAKPIGHSVCSVASGNAAMRHWLITSSDIVLHRS